VRGGVVPPALLFAALACALAFALAGRRWPAQFTILLAALATALAAAQLPLPVKWIEGVFLGLWASTVVTAALVHFPRRLGGAAPLVLAINAGLWAGAATAIAGSTRDIATAAPWLALAVPGAWLVATKRGVAVKVVSSWLIAIAVLAAVLPIVPTPGYAPDHME
jgi:hypothetical protein